MSPQCPLPRLPVRDTYSRARGSLSPSFSVFASGTLWRESKGLRVGRRGQGRRAAARGRGASGVPGQGTEQTPLGASAALVRGCLFCAPHVRRGCVTSRGSMGAGTTGRYSQQHQGGQAHLSLQPCQALPVGKESQSQGGLNGKPGLLGPSGLPRVTFFKGFSFLLGLVRLARCYRWSLRVSLSPLAPYHVSLQAAAPTLSFPSCHRMPMVN